MDFSKLNATKLGDDGAVFSKIIGLDHKPLKGVSVTLLGANSRVGRTAISLALKQRVENSDFVDSIDARRERQLNRMAALTTDWSGIDMDGKEYPCTPENVRKLYSDPAYEWFYAQVIEFVEDTANFLPKANAI